MANIGVVPRNIFPSSTGYPIDITFSKTTGDSEGNRVWYQMWIDPGDMLRIELLLEGGSRTWMIELQKYYVLRERMVGGS